MIDDLLTNIDEDGEDLRASLVFVKDFYGHVEDR